MPVILMGVLDQDVSVESALSYGQLYYPGIHNLAFNRKNFAWSAVQGLYAALVMVLGTLGIDNKSTSNNVVSSVWFVYHSSVSVSTSLITFLPSSSSSSCVYYASLILSAFAQL